MREDVVDSAGQRSAVRLRSGARALLEALAVLGPGEFALIDVAAIAGIDPDDALDELADAGFVRVDTAFGIHVTIIESETRDEVYKSIPGARRRRLHARAASLSTGHEGLRHLTMSAAVPDATLAANLEGRAQELHVAGRHQQASEVWRWAATLSPDRSSGARRRAESDIDRVFAGGIAAAEAGWVHHESARCGYPLLGALIHVWRGRWHAALDLLLTDTSVLDQRGWALLSVAGLRSGRSDTDIGQYLAHVRLEDLLAASPAFARFAIQVRAMLQFRSSPDGRGVLEGDARDVPRQLSYVLAVRGATRVFDGQFDDAGIDLLDVERRLQMPSSVRGDGMLHTLIGAAYWFRGHLAQADVAFARGRMSAWDHDNPLKLALSSLGATGSGDFWRADRVLLRARELLHKDRWHEGIVAFVVAQGARLHAGDDSIAREREAARLRHELGVGAVAPDVSSRGLWLLYRGLLAVWEGNVEDATLCAEHLSSRADIPWARSASLWLHVQIAQENGANPIAVSDGLLQSLTSTFPLLDACATADAARVRSDRALAERAEKLHRRLGLVPYLAMTATASVMDALSEREREVAELVAVGMSYAQIGRRLHLSPSTVKFHLSRVYAKVGVAGRHELVELLAAVWSK